LAASDEDDFSPSFGEAKRHIRAEFTGASDNHSCFAFEAEHFS